MKVPTSRNNLQPRACFSNKEVEVMCCPTEKMIADYNTKPLVGAKFKIFRDAILNLSVIHRSQLGQQECVEQMRV